MARRPWAAVAISRRLLVNLKSGTAIGGILWEERDALIVLRDARLFGNGAPPEGRPVDGDIVIERSNIDFAQVLADQAL